MKIEHIFGKLSASKKVNEDVGFMLTNKNGSYIFLRQKPASRYEGLFMFDGSNMYKTIESINVKNRGTLNKIKNNFYYVEREFNNIKENFLMPANYTSLVYELNESKEVEIILDFKDSYDNKEFGRHYDIFWENKCIVIKFTKRTDAREDFTLGMEQYTLYLAIKYADEQKYIKDEKWIQRHYDFDERRNSIPYSRYVFHAFNLEGRAFVFSMSKEKNKAIEEAIYIFNNLEKIKENEKNAFYSSFSNNKIKKIIESKTRGFSRGIGNEVKIAYIAALNALNNLTITSGNIGILAGLPWFFQLWSRDEAISLKALGNINNGIAKKIIDDRLEKIQEDGRLPNIYNTVNNNNKTNADAIGWLFCMAFSFYENAKSLLKRENKNLSEQISRIGKSIDAITNNYAQNGLIYNNSKETWMDTSFKDNGRAGFNIEIQALMLAMIKHAYKITRDEKYSLLENKIKTNVLRNFLNDNLLSDNLDDKTIKPNIFIAYYVYPYLLSNKEWEKCFEIVLEALWLGFGLSTIDEKSPLFNPNHMGENVSSYHHGDSWFWINNLSAIALFNANKDKFKAKINKIIAASTEDILWKGIIAAHSELSSATELRAEGCLNQAWSNAMFVELVDKIFVKQKF